MDPIFAGQAASLATGKVISTITDIFSHAKVLGKQKQSMVTMTAAARVEPICVVDDQCINLEYTSDVLQAVQSIFCGYYLTALRWCIDPNSVKTLRILNQLDPSRDPERNGESDAFFKKLQGDIKTSIQSLESYGTARKTDKTLSLEAYKYKLPRPGQSMGLEDITGADVMGKDGKEHIVEKTSLAVGKLLEVCLTDNGTTIRLPIAVRLAVNTMSSRGMIGFMTGGADRNIIERFHSWRAGRISFWKDLVLCQDLIKAQKKMMVDDKTGTISEIIKRSANHTRAGLMDKARSHGQVTNLYVISSETADQVEQVLGGKLKNASFRQDFMDRLDAMIIAVIEPEWERVTFYHHGISTHTSLGIRDIRASNKGSGPDIGDILKAFIEGKQPTL